MKAVLLTVAFTTAAAFADPNSQQPDFCNAVGWYQMSCSNAWTFAVPGNGPPGTTIQTCNAHSLFVYGNNGARYGVLDQCHQGQGCTGTMGTYRQPDDIVAQSLWLQYYVTGAGGATAEQIRENFGYYNSSFQIPSGTQHYTFVPMSQIPDPPRHSMQLTYGCLVTTPTPTVKPPTPGPSPTPAPSIYAAYIEAIYNKGITAGCGPSVFCPNSTITRAQESVWIWNTLHLLQPGIYPAVPPPCVGIFSDVPCAH